MGDNIDEEAWLAARFEDHRRRLHGIAYRMLGSVPEAEDAVQDAWLRVSRSGADDVENMGAWLTTIVARVCLNMLQARTVRPESPVGAHIPDPIIGDDESLGPQEEVVLADSVGLALMVVLETLKPDERLAFVLHDVFAVPFDEIAQMVDRSPAAARQLASRARRRVQGARTRTTHDVDLSVQRDLVDAFFGASRRGDFDGLVELLDPDVVFRLDGGTDRPEASGVYRGADAVARQMLTLANPRAEIRPLVVNGGAGVLLLLDGRPTALIGFTTSGGRIVEIDTIADRDRLAGMQLGSP
jgi:RNA polymerase sigma factor (sigma-70 family)